MGFNTVAFLLNDLMHETEQSPKTLAWAICHPPMSHDPRHVFAWREQMDMVADRAGEKRLHLQAIEAFTFHADCTQYIRAGQNGLDYLNVLRYGKNKEKKHTVTLEMPEWYQKEPRWG